MDNFDFKHLAETRRSVRSYSSRPVEPEKLASLLESMRLSPSACNRQPWMFVLVESAVGRECLQKAYDRDWFATAPLYIVVCSKPSEAWTRAFDGKNHADVDVAIATEHLCLAAASMGLGTCWVCNFNPDVVRQLVDADGSGGLEPVAIVPVGYPSEKSKGTSPQVRKPLDELVKIV